MAAVHQLIQYRRHLVIVPASDVDLFKSISHESCEVINENIYLTPYLHGLIDLRIAECGGSTSRKGWYLQQFAKLLALSKLSSNQVGLIWDADTIPLQPIDLIDGENMLFYQGNEHHRPYFDSLYRLLGIGKQYQGSFIAQCIPARGDWIHEMVEDIEKVNGKSWIHAIIDSIDFSEMCGFSEYELLGNYFFYKHSEHFLPINRPWLRRGSLLSKQPHTKIKLLSVLLMQLYDYVAFETSSSREQAIRSLLRNLRSIVKKISFSGRCNYLDDFLFHYFNSDEPKYVIQIGANDGIQNDPLRKYLQANSASTMAILVEPLPYYANKLKKLYQDNKFVTIMPAAIASSESSQPMYYIDPEVANNMNGNGPMNNWAHGQGSFDKEVVKYWIQKNSFRGKYYRSKINHFLESILEISVDMIRLDSFAPAHPNMLLCIDAQGAELDILHSLGRELKPRYIIVEDDAGRGRPVGKYLASLGYSYKGGRSDKVYQFNY